tara:strand:- start:783 stop:1361 length:579 start_codon:yes stop_codon:yes gene_type:complete
MKTSESVWKTLSEINVNDNTEQKGEYTYLSWTWAWATLMEHYPESTYEFLPNEIHPDNSVTTYCTVTVEGRSHTMWLAVMNFGMKANKTPSCTDIANTKMRCLTKCLAMFGLGHYIYAGESLPVDDTQAEINVETAFINEDQVISIKKLIHKNNVDEVVFLEWANIPEVEKLQAVNFDHVFGALKDAKSKAA